MRVSECPLFVLEDLGYDLAKLFMRAAHFRDNGIHVTDIVKSFVGRVNDNADVRMIGFQFGNQVETGSVRQHKIEQGDIKGPGRHDLPGLLQCFDTLDLCDRFQDLRNYHGDVDTVLNVQDPDFRIGCHGKLSRCPEVLFQYKNY